MLGETSDVNLFVYASSLDSGGSICMHLCDSKRS